MKRKRSEPKKKNTHVFEFSPELRLEGANITVFENEGCTITGCEEILKYTDEQVRVRGSRIIVSVEGEELTLRRKSSEVIVLTGRIRSVCFETGV